MSDFLNNNSEDRAPDREPRPEQRPGQAGASPSGPVPPPGYRPAAPGAPPQQRWQAGAPQGPPPQQPRGPYPPHQQRSPYGPPPQQPQWGGYGAPQTGGPMRPPYQSPAPQKMKRSPIPLIIGLVVIVLMGVAFFSALFTGMSGAGGSSGPASFFAFGDKIAILEINGVLGEGPAYGADTIRLREAVERWTDDASIKGMVIRINSPGGAVSATQDLYQAIEEFKAGGNTGMTRPVVASMGDVAASGGYYIAMAADEIYANPGTLTGSVGVILNFWGYEGLSEKIGLEPRTVKSGQFKDIGSGARPMSEAEKALLNDMIVSVFDQFYEVVYDARHDEIMSALAEQTGRSEKTITDEEIRQYLREYTDGRIFSGQQAYEWALVDRLGTLDDAEEDLKARLGLSQDAHEVGTPQPPQGLFGMLNQKAESIRQFGPGHVTMEYRFSM